ncbi:3,4-dihydroxy 2-butanone 4-phosphate synthase, partial [Phytophthora boehmeriae]
LQTFAKECKLPLVTISDLIRYRSRTETLVERTSENPTNLVTPFGEFLSVEYKSLVQDEQTFHALVFGDVKNHSEVPVFLVEDDFEAGLEAQWAQQQIARHGYGVVIYVHGSSQLMQISGELMARQSIFGMAMQIVRDLNINSVCLLSMKESNFDPSGFGVDVVGSKRLTTST